LNERQLRRLPGVHEASINYATQQARVTWDEEIIHLSEIIGAIRSVGYDAHPYDPDRRQRILEQQRRTLLKQVGVAAAFGMQVMILTVALYAGEWYGMEEEFERFFRRFSLLLTIPVLFYSGRGFFQRALIDLKFRRVSMDVPVSAAIALAFTASTWHVITGSGEIYFESVCMFVLFLLGARYFELMSRMRAMIAAESIGYIKPAGARRLHDENAAGDDEIIAALDLRPGDRVRILPGDTVPMDGIVVAGQSGIDESVLTGESRPVRRKVGDMVIGGSINTDSPLVVRVTRTSEDTVLARIHRLLDDAFSAKPLMAQLADRIAAFFVSAVLLLTALVALYWIHVGSGDWLRITISVLVVSCPCALSLAVPTALSSSIAGLMQQKILVVADHALETLPKVTRFVFDKTGTLTLGRPRVNIAEAFYGDKGSWLSIAAALERSSEHPLSRAIRDAATESPTTSRTVVDPGNQPGGGVWGLIEGRLYRLGSRSFIAAALDAAQLPPPNEGIETEILLADESRVLCRFLISDRIRADSAATVEALKSRGLKTVLLSGDSRNVAESVAAQLGIDEVFAECTPEQKLEWVRRWQASGEVVAMIGDGINDAPVLAGADVSISVGGAAAITVASADIVSISEDIYPVVNTLDAARKTARILRQNFSWSVGYNLLAIPFAAAGLVAPWLAALGMSLSSLIVITNASRLRSRANPRQDAAPAPVTLDAPEPLR
jgi:P-type Cu2+ transporter